MIDLTISDLENAREVSDIADPARQWREDREVARRIDSERGRGHLVVNPEIPELAEYEGAIVDHEGGEFRVEASELLRGARTKEGAVVFGYWVAGTGVDAGGIPLPWGVP